MKSQIKAFIFVLAALLLASSLISCATVDPSIPEGMQLCPSEVANYNLYVPAEWTISFTTGAVGAYCSNEDPSSVTVMSWDIEANSTVNDWWEMYQSDLALVFDDIDVISSEPTVIDEVAAMKYTYTAKLGENEFYYTQYACIHWNAVYILTFTSTPANFESHLSELDNIVTNFQFH